MVSVARFDVDTLYSAFKAGLQLPVIDDLSADQEQDDYRAKIELNGTCKETTVLGFNHETVFTYCSINDAFIYGAGGGRYELHVDGMACPYCAYGIEKIKALDGVDKSSVIIKLNDGLVIFEADTLNP